MNQTISRYRAAGVHLLISAVVVASILAIVFFVWYPEWTFEIAGAKSPVAIMVGVDLVLGPLLTLIIYKQGKPGLKFDLWFIATVQLAALAYGSWTLYGERPHYLVYAVDRVTLVAKRHVDLSQLSEEFSEATALGKIATVFARAPEDPEAFQRFMDSVLFEGQPDLEYRTEFWEPWAAGADAMREEIIPISGFTTDSATEQALIDEAVDRLGSDHAQLGMLPVGGIEQDIGVLIDIESLEVLEVIEVNLW